MHPLATVHRTGAVLIAALLAAAGPVVGASGGAGDTAARCTRLEARIDALRLKLRLGYTARQGRLWREQLRGLEAERRAACR